MHWPRFINLRLMSNENNVCVRVNTFVHWAYRAFKFYTPGPSVEENSLLEIQPKSLQVKSQVLFTCSLCCAGSVYRFSSVRA